MKRINLSSIEHKHFCTQNPVFVMDVSGCSAPVWWLPAFAFLSVSIVIVFHRY